MEALPDFGFNECAEFANPDFDIEIIEIDRPRKGSIDIGKTLFDLIF